LYHALLFRAVLQEGSNVPSPRGCIRAYDFLLVLAKKPEYFLSAFLLPQWGHLTGGWASNSFMER
jgi:hypothetical protein